MKIYKKDALIHSLKQQGLGFSEFSMIHEGGYTVEDADWNYKDVPHLHYIHQLVEAVPAVIGDDVIATINMQKIFGINLPLCVFNYQSDSNAQTYYTTLFCFVLIIETSYESIGECKTRVTTNYNIGYPKLLKWCFPLLRFAIKRNYKDLMSGDIPMRERRGNLRKAGFIFHKAKEFYSFEDTLYIVKDNVTPPVVAQSPEQTLDLLSVLPANGEHLIGTDDHLGLRLIRQDNMVCVYPRMCFHEGASLDNQQCVNNVIKCPWHGRIAHPLAKFDLSHAQTQTAQSKYHHLSFSNHMLIIRYFDLPQTDSKECANTTEIANTVS